MSLGWHVISGEAMLDMLRRVAGGEDADAVYAEEYANAERERVPSREVVVIARALATHSRNGTPYEGPYNIEDWYEYARMVARALREDAER